MGFSIEIQCDLTEEEQNFAEEFAKEFLKKTTINNMDFPLKGAGGRRSFLRRNRFGYYLNAFEHFKGSDLTFRRISKRRRKFAIVKVEELIKRDLSEVNLKQCACPQHLGGELVVWRKSKPKMYEYIKIGVV